MFRALLRTSSRQARPVQLLRPRPRHLSTAPPHELSRSWKNSAVRWGIAIAGVYYYNTSDVFAQEPQLRTAHEEDESLLPTLDSLSPSNGKRTSQDTSSTASNSQIVAEDPGLGTSLGGNPEDLEEEAHSEGAFNEETGEINWDCPCLGGMAYGPCGEEFREAFSCFVYSKEEPKGMDCIDRFQHMQNCFRAHPDVYGAELEDDEEDEHEPLDEKAGKAVMQDEAAHVAVAPDEDAAGVVAVSQAAKEELRPDPKGKTATSTQNRNAARTDDRGVVEDSSTPTKEPVTQLNRSGGDAEVPLRPNSSAKASAPSTTTKALDYEPAPSKLPKETSANTRKSEPDAGEDIVPKAAHDARDAPVGKA